MIRSAKPFTMGPKRLVVESQDSGAAQIAGGHGVQSRITMEFHLENLEDRHSVQG